MKAQLTFDKERNGATVVAPGLYKFSYARRVTSRSFESASDSRVRNERERSQRKGAPACGDRAASDASSCQK